MSSTVSSSPVDGRTPVRVLADNLMRRALRISDPGNALQVADGLKRAYPTQGAALDLEIRGFPLSAPAPVSVAPQASSMAAASLTRRPAI